jgi:NAD(P)-dependent dehydrogenase (short-subunit alcohol dehydrogenase family)
MTMPVEYAVIKSGVLQLTKYLARYLSGDNIRVNAISPGGIADGQAQPFMEAYRSYCLGKGMLDAGDVSGALLFLLSDLSQFVNGQNLVVDDGFSL